MSDPWYGRTISGHETAEFLNEQATGVLSLANEWRAYGIPMPFAYDDANDRALMDLVFVAESKKREFILTTDEVCLTVYEWNSPHKWTSVVVTDPFERLDDDVDDDLEEGIRGSQRISTSRPGISNSSGTNSVPRKSPALHSTNDSVRTDEAGRARTTTNLTTRSG